MKKLILLLLTVTAYFTAFGQTDYYTGQTQVSGKNVTYSCQNNGISFRITNVNKVFIGQTQKMRDGTPADEGPAISYDFGMNDPDRTLISRAFRETFTPEQINTIREQKADVLIGFYANPTGIIKDLFFQVTKTPATVSVPPDQWFTLEQKLKQYVTAKQEICKNYQFAVFFTVLPFNEL